MALEIAHAREALADATETVANLGHAMEGRTIIGQATGILMARRKLTAEQAFDVLKRTHRTATSSSLA